MTRAMSPIPRKPMVMVLRRRRFLKGSGIHSPLDWCSCNLLQSSKRTAPNTYSDIWGPKQPARRVQVKSLRLTPPSAFTPAQVDCNHCKPWTESNRSLTLPGSASKILASLRASGPIGSSSKASSYCEASGDAANAPPTALERPLTSEHTLTRMLALAPPAEAAMARAARRECAARPQTKPPEPTAASRWRRLPRAHEALERERGQGDRRRRGNGVVRHITS
mmetsp:Transcript_113430/g.315856  ORF Transcript_113430/g.315856 Transcript_113430/m.315856 type:complete len:222 (-) Transcript_113430:16-681(-)